MHHAATDNRPDIDLIADIVTPLYIVTALLTLLALSILVGTQQGQQILSYVFPGALMLSTCVAHIVRRLGRLVLSGMVMAVALGPLPLVTLFTDGIQGNYVVFIAPVGILLGMVIGSIRAGVLITLISLALITL